MISYISETTKKITLIPQLLAQAPYSVAIVILQCLSGFFSVVGIPLLIPVLDYLKDGNVTAKSKVLLHMQEVMAVIGVPVTFGSLLVIAGLLFIVGQILLTISTQIAVFAQAEMAQHYRNQLMDSYARVNWPWLLDSRTGEINYFTLRESDMASVAHVNAQRVVIYLVQFFVLLVIAVELSLKVTCMAMAVYACIAVGNMFLSRRIVRSATEYHRTFSKLSNDLVVLQQNKKFFKTSLLNSKMTSAIKEIIKSIAHLTKYEISLMEYQRIMGMTITFTFLLGVMYWHQSLGLEYSSLLVILFVFSRIAPNFSQLTTAFATLDSNIPAYRAVRRRLSDLEANQEKNGSQKFQVEEDIRFDEVSFSYPNGKSIFSKTSFSIASKKATAFIGPSGSGKSTLLDLLLGLLEPTSGTIFYGQISHDHLDKVSLRSTVAYVGQDTTLIDGTIEENLSIRVEGLEKDDLENVLRKVGLDRAVSSMPDGIKTKIGENGVKLSGGQRQRLAIARALLMEPKVLILDEVTSHLDEESERQVVETLVKLKGDLTMVAISHRPTSISFCDSVFSVGEGSVRQAGTIDESKYSGITKG